MGGGSREEGKWVKGVWGDRHELEAERDEAVEHLDLSREVSQGFERAAEEAERDLADALRLLYRSVLAYHRETHILDDFAVCGVPLCKEVRDRFPKEVANAN